MPKIINWEKEAATCRKLYQKELERAKSLHNALLSLPKDFEEYDGDVGPQSIRRLDYLIQQILENHQ